MGGIYICRGHTLSIMIEECLVVEFAVSGDRCPLAEATAATGLTVDAEPPQRRGDGNTLLQFSSPADSGLAAVLDDDSRIRYLHVARTNDRQNFRCLSREPCVVHELIDAGFLVDSMQYVDGEERYTGAVVGRDVLQGVLEAAGETVGVTLQRMYPLGDEDDHAVAHRWDVSPAQEAALQTAYEMGYFEIPKAATASEVAAELDISKSAFLERLRRGQRGVFGQLFD